MITKNTNLHLVVEKSSTSYSTTSTFLIPENLMEALILKKQQHRGIQKYLNFLLSKYKKEIQPKYPEYIINKKYQEKGQYLNRVSFRPYGEDWMELKRLASLTGFSLCQIFIFMFQKDLNEELEIEDTAIAV